MYMYALHISLEMSCITQIQGLVRTDSMDIDIGLKPDKPSAGADLGNGEGGCTVIDILRAKVYSISVPLK